ncbi:MAG: MvaI/BcnI restriction endonuclease family protein [Phycisphaerales bacterium]|nr:MvaI/BcnI restriction endonuclease family protein [Phycisphaerales bacterium]
MSIISKSDFIAKLKDIRNRGWIQCARPGNSGGVGNTLEDLLGIAENNLPIPNAAEWELKTQRANTGSLTTLKHMEPSPRAARLVPRLLLPNYGWKHEQAGLKYGATERSFRQTISATGPTDRGFRIIVNHEDRNVLISFDAKHVDSRHADWLTQVKNKVGLGQLNPQPYWGFDDLFHSVGTKLVNCFYVVADVETRNGHQFYAYNRIQMLETFSLERFLKAVEEGNVLIDFDARSGHNHGTKIRLRQGMLSSLYARATEL